jgi:serine/threonine-protein kinase PknK
MTEDGNMDTDKHHDDPVDPFEDLGEAAYLDDSLGASRSTPAALVGRLQAQATNDVLAVLRDFAQVATGNLDLQSLVRETLDQAIRVAGADRGIVFLGREKEGSLTPALAHSIAGEEIDHLERISRTILNQARLGDFVLTLDALHDPRFADAPSIALKQVRMVACLPLRANGETIGLIYLDAPHGTHAFKEGAHHKLETLANLAAAAIENARQHGEVLDQNRRLRRQLDALDAFGPVVSVDPAMAGLMRRAALMAQADMPLMVLGETGTGKELIARSVHQAGPRALRPFIAQNCAALPAQLIDALVFGHEKGIFSGAHRSRPGFFELADGGTLFLDEVAELDYELQAKLLRVVEDGRVRRLGADHEIEVDVRIVSATSQDILRAVRAGRFREELYHRLSVLELRVPALRERRGDIAILAQYFVQRHAPTEAHRERTAFTREAIEFLQGLHWPGNVRTLENLVRRALVLCEPGPIDLLDVRGLLANAPGEPATGPRGPDTPWHRDVPAEGSPAWDARRGEIREAMYRSAGNQSRAANLLGCHRNTLRRWIREFGIVYQR